MARIRSNRRKSSRALKNKGRRRSCHEAKEQEKAGKYHDSKFAKTSY